MREIRVGVYVKNCRFSDKALEFVNKLIEENGEKIINTIKSRDYKRVVTDSSIYEVIIASQNARGYQFNIIYYQNDIDEDIYEYIIESQIMPYMPYGVMRYYFRLEDPIRKINLGVV